MPSLSQQSHTKLLVIEGTLQMAKNTLSTIDQLLEDAQSTNQQENKIVDAIDDDELYDVVYELHELKSLKNEQTKDSIQYVDQQINRLNEIIESHSSDSSDDETLELFCTELSKNSRNNIDTNFKDLSAINSNLDSFLHSDDLRKADRSIQKQAHTIFDQSLANISQSKEKFVDVDYLIDLIENLSKKEGQTNA